MFGGESGEPRKRIRHGLPDHEFDLVMSIFGAMFAPEPFEVAKEMVRVTKRGRYFYLRLPDRA